MECSKSSTKRDVYSKIGYLEKQEISQINSLRLYFKEQKKRKTNELKVSRRGKYKHQRENKREFYLKDYLKITETKSWFLKK